MRLILLLVVVGMQGVIFRVCCAAAGGAPHAYCIASHAAVAPLPIWDAAGMTIAA